MKKTMTLIATVILLLTISVTGCNKKSEEPKKDSAPKSTENKESKVPSKSDVEKSLEDTANALKKADEAGLLVSADKKKWPVKLLPSNLPEYTKGKLFAWNGDEKECLIMIHETSKKDLEEFQKLIKGKGWNESNGDYKQPPYYIRFQFNTDTALQMTVYKDDVLAWPKDRIPNVPPLTAGVLTQVYFDKDYPESLQLTVEGLSEDKIMEYEKVLISKGFKADGDKSYTKEKDTLNGKQYSKITMWFDSNGPEEWIINLSGE